MFKQTTISCINLIRAKNMLNLLNKNNLNIRSTLNQLYSNKLGANNYTVDKTNIKKPCETLKNYTKDKTKVFSPKITLINQKETTIITKEEAENIAKRKHLKLIKISDFDHQTKRAIYKLTSETDLINDDSIDNKNISKKGSIKGDKLLSLNARISDHDLSSRIKNTVKWLQKNYEVRVLISGCSNEANNSEAINKIISSIESNIVNYGKIVQKANKGGNMKFKISPISTSSTNSTGKDDNSNEKSA